MDPVRFGLSPRALRRHRRWTQAELGQRAGDTLEAFLEDYPNVLREQGIAVIEAAQQTLLA